MKNNLFKKIYSKYLMLLIAAVLVVSAPVSVVAQTQTETVSEQKGGQSETKAKATSNDTGKPAETVKKQEETKAPEETAKQEETKPSDEAAKKQEETKASDETVKQEETKAPEETAKQEETKAPEETVKQEETKASDETSKQEETKAPDETVKQEETKAPEETAKQEETKASDETAKQEETKAPEETSKQEETKASDETKEKKDAVEDEKTVKPEESAKEKESKKAEKPEEKEKKDPEKTKEEVKLLNVNPAEVDSSTPLADGEYTDFDFKWEGGTGKARLDLTRITVQNGKATGYFTASSANMTHVYYLGHTGSDRDNPAYYDPATGKCGKGVVPIESQTVSFPVDLNNTTEIACRTVAMTEPHWVQYAYTITIDETDKELYTDLSVTNQMEGLKITQAKLGVMKNSKKTTLYITAGNKDFSKLYLGTAAQAEENAGEAIALSNGEFVISDVKTDAAFKAAFYCKTDKIWHEGTVKVDKSAKSLLLKEGKKADYSKVEAAKKKVPKDLSIYKSARVKVLKDALKAVKEGLYASQQDKVDAFATQILKAIKALEKDKITIRIKALDEKTGKTIKGAEIIVKDKDGNIVKADKPGVYSLEDGRYTLIAQAKNYEKAVKRKFRPTVEETIKLELTPKEVIPEGTTIFKEDENNPKKTNLFNKTPMFKLIKGTLVNKDGKRYLTIVLSGQGYHYLFKGTYEEALANGQNKKNWIKGKLNADGKWEFVIKLKEDETYIPIVSISDAKLKEFEAGKGKFENALFARQLDLNLKKKTLTSGDYDAVIDIKVVSKTEKFKADEKGTMEVVGGPNSNNYACKPVITMQDNLYSEAFIGTAADAAKAGAEVIKKQNGGFKFELVNSFGENGRVRMFEDKKPVAVAFYDTEKKAWTDYKLTIDKAASTVTIEALKEDEAPPEKPEEEDPEYQDDQNTQTAPVDSQTTLKDGVYTPDGFRFSGGTGKIVITCTQIEVKGGQVFATIHFGKPGGRESSVDRLRANGQEYSGFNTFTIPVQLNANNTVVARTTAMSVPHWIEYTIYVVMNEPGKESTGKDLSENTDKLDEEAPEIIGLTTEGQIETPYSDLVKIFTYKDGYYLIEVDAVRDTARDTLAFRTKMEKAALEEKETTAAAADEKAAEELDAEEGVQEETGENGTEKEESMSEKIAKLYENEIIKYLVIPDGKEVPAGMDKEVIILHQPADKAYVSSDDALQMIADLGALSNVTTVGMEEEQIKVPAVKEAMEKDAGSDGAVSYAGSYDDWDLKTMIKAKTNLSVESSKLLPGDEKTIEKDMENFVRLGERSAQLDLAMFMDRSSDEKTTLGKAEWLKVYGVIFHASDAADKLYKEAVDKVSEQEKKDAKEQLEKRAKEKEEMQKAAKEAARR